MEGNTNGLSAGSESCRTPPLTWLGADVPSPAAEEARMAIVAQYSDGGGGGVVVAWLLVLGALAFIPASIASSKGDCAAGFWASC